MYDDGHALMFLSGRTVRSVPGSGKFTALGRTRRLNKNKNVGDSFGTVLRNKKKIKYVLFHQYLTFIFWLVPTYQS